MMKATRMAYVMLLMIILNITCLLTTVQAQSQSGELIPVVSAVQGKVNLQNIQAEEDKHRIPLFGEWEFYWKQLIEPKEFQQANNNLNPSYIKVPSSWANQPRGSGIDSTYGYGTYRIQLKIPSTDIGKSKALYVRSIGSAYRIWFNGVEKAGLGVVATNREAETPQAFLNMIFMQPDKEELEIVIQTSNFSFREGGIISEVLYGDTGALIIYVLKKMFYDISVIGGFAFMGLFHLVLYSFRRKDFSTLFIGLLGLAISVRTIVLNGYLASLILGINHWELLTKIEYFSEIFGFLFLVLLMKFMYPKETNRYMVYLSYGITVFLLLYISVLPARDFTETMLLQTAVKAIILLYTVFYVGFLAFLRKREGAFINLTALFILISAGVNDMLYYLRIVNTVELLNICAVLFILAQAIIVSYRYSRISNRNDSLVIELGSVNATLEEKVAARTQKLHETNEELSEMKAVRTKMLVNIAHDLSSPLVGVQTYLHLMDEGTLPMGRQDITQQLLEKTTYIQQLISDLFDLSKLETKEQAFRFEHVKADEWLKAVNSKFAPNLQEDDYVLQMGRIETRLNDHEVYLRMDTFRITQVLQNYIDNAKKFSVDSSRVITLNGYLNSQSETGAHLLVEIADEGVGIATEELNQVFRRFYKRREGNEQGSGLGLTIVKEIIEQHAGTVGVRSELGSGSTFYFTLPVTLALEED